MNIPVVIKTRAIKCSHEMLFQSVELIPKFIDRKKNGATLFHLIGTHFASDKSVQKLEIGKVFSILALRTPVRTQKRRKYCPISAFETIVSKIQKLSCLELTRSKKEENI